MNLAQRMKLMKHFGSLPPEPPPPTPPPLMAVPDSKLGFGFAISGGRDKPNPESGDTAIVVSDVLPNGPAMGRLFTKDNIVMVNGVSMENVHSNFTIQNLKSCGRTANVRGRPRARSSSPSNRNGHSNAMPLMSTAYKRLPNNINDVAEKPIRATLLKKKLSDEYGLKLGSQIFIKHMTDTGLASREGTLQEGDLILKINGMTTENLSLLETKHLVEKSRGKLTMTVLRDSRKFLVSIPEIEDSAPNSEEDRRHDSSSEMEVQRFLPYALDSDQTYSQVQRLLPCAIDSDQAYSKVQRLLPRALDSDQAYSQALLRPPRSLSGLSTLPTLPNQRSPPTVQNWGTPRTSSAAGSKPRRPVSESDSDRSASPPPLRKASPRPNSRYKVLPDLPIPGMRASPINVRQEPPRRVSSPVRVPPPDSESESDESGHYPPRQGTPYSEDSRNRYRVLPELATKPQVDPPLWSPPTATATATPPKRVASESESESEASYASVPRRESSDSGESNKVKDRYRVSLPEIQSVPLKHTPSQGPPPGRPAPDDSFESDQLFHLRRSGSSEQESNHGPARQSKTATVRSGISVKNPTIYSKPEEEPLYSLPPDSYPTPSLGYSSDLHTVSFTKDGSIGLRLVGGNDVGIFVGGVQPNSPAQERGMKEGDQIMQVNKVDFNHFTREEAANFLLHIKHGEPVEICTQNKMDLYKKILKSSLGDNFYVRTHFDQEAEGNIGLGFTRGEVFRVVDTMHRGKLGNWLAIRMGNDLHELDKGTIPNQARADTLAVMEQAQRASGDRQVSGPRAEFWKLRGLRGAKKNVRRSRDDLLQLTIQGKFPAYEKVLLREANFKRPIVILGPLNDIAMEKLAREMPDDYEVAAMVPRSGGGDSASTVIKLDTVRAIAEKDKHPLLDITPTAVERLNYIQYHPMVLFLDPHSRKDIKAMRQRYSPDSNKSSRRLRAPMFGMMFLKTRSATSRLNQSGCLRLRGGEQDLDTLDQNHSDYLSAASDLEDTDGEPFTDGEVYTDNEDLDEAFPGQDIAAAKLQRVRTAGSALARSSEPAFESDLEPVVDNETYALQEMPPLMHVPDMRGPRQEEYSPPRTGAASTPQDNNSHRSFSDSDFSTTEAARARTPSEGPPDFVAPNPTRRVFEPLENEVMEPESESPPSATLTAIEEKLQQARLDEPQERKPSPSFIALAHHQAVQYRRTQIRGSDSSNDEKEEEDDIEWGPATEL
ncbi:hypothetical protein CRUP_021994 [Coryphaenoides rupestris]|nr:hypothetical protein CRUP_021994 [Coryphaenoides rupestris]